MSFHDVVEAVAVGVCILYIAWMGAYIKRQPSKVHGSYLTQRDENAMLFRRPLSQRRISLAVCGLFLALLFVTLSLAAANGLTWKQPAFYYLSGDGLGLALLFVYLSGPRDIRLDASQRRYEMTTGWPWNPVTHFGSFDDIQGVSVSPSNTVSLQLKKPGAIFKGVVVSSSGTQMAAQALAEDLSREFNFPIVPYPK